MVVWKNSLSDAVLMWSFVSIRTNSCSLALARLESPKHTLKHLGQRHTSSELKGAHVRGRLLLGDMVVICLHLLLFSQHRSLSPFLFSVVPLSLSWHSPFSNKQEGWSVWTQFTKCVQIMSSWEDTMQVKTNVLSSHQKVWSGQRHMIALSCILKQMLPSRVFKSGSAFGFSERPTKQRHKDFLSSTSRFRKCFA